MNWSLGLLWLWVLATVLWIGVIAFVAYDRWPQVRMDQLGLAAVLTPEVPAVDVERRAWWIHISITATFAAIPPVGLLAVGWAGLWAARGFSHN